MEASSSTSTMIATDPVSSLRAAALSTLKSKRRKQVPETPAPIPPRPPPPSDTFQLDYGQDDVSMVDVGTSVSSTTVQDIKEQISPLNEDVHMREEGEISEEEEPSHVMKQAVPLIERLSDSPMPVMRESSIPESPSTVKTEPSPSPRSMTPEAEHIQTPRLALVDRISDEPYVPDEETYDAPSPGESPAYIPPTPYIGPDCVRPGLDLNQEEYDTVKDIILDLLGWGVTFEYLFECGLSKEVLYYVFNELDLRLPDSFDASGIVPYTPEAFSFPRQSASLSPSLIDDEEYLIPLEPNAVASIEPTSRPTTPPPTQVALPIPDSPAVADLHDMERQRRQELLARKAAVLASRKQKQVMMLAAVNADVPHESKVIGDEQHITGPAVPDVDDFLNSLAPVQQLEDSSAGVSSLQQVVDTEIMQVDAESHHEHAVPLVDVQDHLIESSVPEFTSVNMPVQARNFSEPPLSTEPPPTPVDSFVSTFSESSQSSDASPSPFFPSLRRGIKRPVASDFVDLEPAVKRQEILDREHINRHSKPVGITRKLTSNLGFQGIASRRCVIDLSDSEDDGDDTAQNEPEQPPLVRRDWRHKLPSNVSSLVPSRPLPSSATAPAALAEKEAEIRKMREMIARREERLRKLALTRSASATTNNQPADISKSNASNSLSTSGVEPMEPETPKLEEQEEDVNRMESTPNSVSRTESSTSSPIGSSATDIGETGAVDLEINPKSISEKQDEASDTQNEQAASTIQHSDDPKTHLIQRGSVDADQNPSPSTQVLPAATPSVHPKQDANWLEPSQPSNLNSENEDKIQDVTTFTSYRSPFDSYPLLLRDSLLLSTGVKAAQASHSDLSLVHSSSLMNFDPSSAYTKHSISLDPSTPRLGISLPNMKPLKQITMMKLLDPFKRICQYEVPGGGTCRDEGCEDVHLSRLEGANQMGIIEPNDNDTAQYLFNILPDWWLSKNGIDSPSRILSALHDVHHKSLNSSLGFEDRIKQAIETLVSSTPTT